ncbi:outer membrane lipoprotein-sorting protein [Microbulbifer spongiae]|uniref:Outer membrane lipoprotein-sorting protein n=1 Tax=Microbulbifer spongiae TaxID=2944933 RepID=A0ABY9EGI1_9GAMM|nr:outer membrane lipoprotein-sorting protein [Microbulbifer sp. MI-G]WKD51566.1 outer membrane lipoprotein-sorting protein [Microbulbifer sp. MI-G]
MRIPPLIMITLCLGLYSTLLDAEIKPIDPVAKGFEIASEMIRRDSGWVDQRVEMEMILSNKQGESSTRLLKISRLEVENDGDKTLTTFHYPKDIKGTAFLSYTHSLDPDDQWLYLPALKRIKRISSVYKSGPFVGSEFAYEDMTSQELERYTYKWLRDETVDDREAFVIERKPVYEYSGYHRQIVWLDKIMYQPLRLDYYDRKDSLLKVLTFEGYKQYLNGFWRPEKMLMENIQTGKKTLLIMNNYQFENGFNDRDFDRSALRRSRN